MAKYYISTGLWTTDIKEFPNDKAAWEELRKLLPHKFATLLKEKEVEVPVNNEESYVKEYNSKYGPKPIGYGPEDAKLMKVGEKNIHTMYVPVLEGITDDEYNVPDEFERMLAREVPKSLLNKEQFDSITNLHRLDAIKYITSVTKCGLKLAAIYYDLYLRDYE